MTARLSQKRCLARMLAVGLLASFGGRAAQDAPPPNTVEQERLLAAMRGYAEQYIENLPNFICEQVTRQYRAGRKPNRWRQGDVLTSKLMFSQGQEQRSLQLVNDRPIRA